VAEGERNLIDPRPGVVDGPAGPVPDRGGAHVSFLGEPASFRVAAMALQTAACALGPLGGLPPV
jgi:hypothetical protein